MAKRKEQADTVEEFHIVWISSLLVVELVGC